MVLVEATVRDDKGRIADDLKREDFRVFEDGVEQKIIYFSRDELPLAVALVVDGSGSISPMRSELHDAANNTLCAAQARGSSRPVCLRRAPRAPGRSDD